MKKHFNKAAAFLGVSAIAIANLSSASAAVQIGTGTVTGSGGLSTPVMWNETYTANSASGTVNGVVVTAKILPTLNMNISADLINLGTLTPGTPASGNVTLELGTNAANGVQVTARSTNGRLQHTANVAAFIGSAHTGESYKFASTPGSNDSSYGDYLKTATLNAEVTNNTTEHVVVATNRPEKSQNQDDVTFTVSATANDEASAGDYRDVVVFTVTGNF